MEASGAADLSDGIVVRTQLLGRLLGLRVLRIDGTVLVSPARPSDPARIAPVAPVAPVASPARPNTTITSSATTPPGRISGRVSGRVSRPPGAELAEAARLLEDLS